MNLRDTIVRIMPSALLFVATGLLALPARAQSDIQKIYTTKCASCHGPDGSANTPAGKALKTRDFHAPDVQKESDTSLATIIAKGKSKMPAYEKQLKDTEIKQLVAYIRDLGKK